MEVADAEENEDGRRFLVDDRSLRMHCQHRQTTVTLRTSERH